jgi:hypothetical protein
MSGSPTKLTRPSDGSSDPEKSNIISSLPNFLVKKIVKVEFGNLGTAKVNPQRRDNDGPATTNTLSNLIDAKSLKPGIEVPDQYKISGSINSTPNRTPGPSILKKLRASSQSTRNDANGVPIVKGGKRHKIKFKENIVEVQIVENWKEYNSDSTPSSSCHCAIF